MKTAELLESLPVRHKSEGCCEPAAPPSLSGTETAALASTLRAAGDATRLGMLDLLAQQQGPLCVCDITTQFPQNQPTISHHLGILREAGLVESEKRGLWSYYWVTDAGRRCLDAVELLKGEPS
jgi:ArsR family transcriptional regulator